MAETLTMPDGTPVDIDAAEQVFHAAMAAPEPDETPDYPAPPRKDPAAPPKPARGRKTGDDQPRTAKRVPAAPGKGKTADVPLQDFTKGLTDVGTAVWVGLAGLPWTRPYSVLWKAQLPAQVNAWNNAAAENAQVRAKVAKIASGEGNLWILGVALATAPLAGGVVALLGDREVRAQFAAQAEADLDAWMKANMPQPEDEPAPAAA